MNAAPDLRGFLQSTAALIAITNPLAAVPVFLALVPGGDAQAHGRAARSVAVAVFAILAGAVVLGRSLLQLFGISFAAFRVGGGLVVALTGLGMLQGRTPEPEDESAHVSRADQLIVPVAMPIIAGPASITTVMTLAAHGSGTLPPWAVILGAAVAAAVVWLTLALALRLERHLGARGQAIIMRFMGLVLVAVGAQLALTGVKEFFAAG